jgi:hypothetical protein
MIFKNDIKVVLKTEPIYIKNKVEFDGLLKGKSHVNFTTADKIVVNKTGHTEYQRFHSIPLEEVINDGITTDKWVYTDMTPIVKANQQLEYRSKRKRFQRVLTIPIAERELIFFLLYISSNASKGVLTFVDVEKDAEKKLAELAAGSAVTHLLTSKYSILTDVKITNIAKAWGIERTDKMTMPQIKLALKSVIERADVEKDTSRGEKAFMEAVDMEDSVNVRSVVQTALDTERIVFNIDRCGYYYKNSGGNELDQVVKVDMIVRDDLVKRKAVLFNHFTNRPERFEQLRGVMGIATTHIDFTKYTYMILKRFAGANNIDQSGTQAVLGQRLADAYNQEKNTRQFDISMLPISDE